MEFSTKMLHSPYPSRDAHGSLRYPIYQSAAFEFDSAEDMEAAFGGRKKAHTYTRASNPTVEEFELKVLSATNACGVVATSSGMAAISNVLLSLLKAGDNIITTTHLFGHTLSLFKTLLPPLGVEVRFVDMNIPQEIEKAVDENTKVIFCESISNPMLSIPDFSKLSLIAKQNNVLLIADTTMTPFNVFDSKKWGVDIEVISSTKFISGGGNVIGGLIVDNGLYDWSKYSSFDNKYRGLRDKALIGKLKKETFRNLGAALSANSAYMLSLGLETLDLRMQKSYSNTLEILEYLKTDTKIYHLNHPSLKKSDYHELAQSQFLSSGSILTFDLSNKDAAYRFLNNLKVIRRSTNIQDNKSLAIAPYHTIYAEYDSTQKKSIGLQEGMVRLSIGIEDANDLKEDISIALKEV